MIQLHRYLPARWFVLISIHIQSFNFCSVVLSARVRLPVWWRFCAGADSELLLLLLIFWSRLLAFRVECFAGTAKFNVGSGSVVRLDESVLAVGTGALLLLVLSPLQQFAAVPPLQLLASEIKSEATCAMVEGDREGRAGLNLPVANGILLAELKGLGLSTMIGATDFGAVLLVVVSISFIHGSIFFGAGTAEW
jgi:hypothetical protein